MVQEVQDRHVSYCIRLVQEVLTGQAFFYDEVPLVSRKNDLKCDR